MPFYRRDIEKTLKRFAKFPVVALLGPRQSGKTTLAKHTFKNHTYLNLDDLELLDLIKNDPKGTLRKYENKYGIIIDEFQNAPELLSYIKVIVDEKNRPGYFILTGSQNFLMNEAITQTLAGRVGILTLLPFSLHELSKNKLLKKGHPEVTIFRGG
jgi:predicted AAA+ superfamily ATPase